ncbi:hypothetical protein Tco_0233792 [Tanacetum coccineum]
MVRWWGEPGLVGGVIKIEGGENMRRGGVGRTVSDTDVIVAQGGGGAGLEGGGGGDGGVDWWGDGWWHERHGGLRCGRVAAPSVALRERVDVVREGVDVMVRMERLGLECLRGVMGSGLMVGNRRGRRERNQKPRYGQQVVRLNYGCLGNSGWQRVLRAVGCVAGSGAGWEAVGYGAERFGRCRGGGKDMKLISEGFQETYAAAAELKGSRQTAGRELEEMVDYILLNEFGYQPMAI